MQDVHAWMKTSANLSNGKMRAKKERGRSRASEKDLIESSRCHAAGHSIGGMGGALRALSETLLCAQRNI